MSMGSAFKNFSMGRELSRTREPSSRGPSIDLERSHPGYGEQQSIVVEQSEKERRAFVPDADAAASDAEAGTAQLWTGRIPIGISTGHIIGSGNTLAAGDVIGSSSARGVDISAAISTGKFLRLPEHGDTVGENGETVTERSGDGEHDESAQTGDVVKD
ncbi:hypothetical protein QBC32DRAFT_225321 [Pseudoneurospora amorphoporcata]|uniref:Uncharacterized protein n=1 Tax=Pseudoneurospora amorphoporcata TaxID=241081 RepID=A0AAN6SBJ1_9PEZI|nr:hypothetical protein QBC32DRAFT_225321 [Pseudoneurospora amorphoporcata]